MLGPYTDYPPLQVRAAFADRLTADSLVIITWTARWLVNTAAGPTAAKRELISRRVAKEYIMCVQETHWSPADAALWKHGLLLNNCFCSPAVPKDNAPDSASATED